MDVNDSVIKKKNEDIIFRVLQQKKNNIKPKRGSKKKKLDRK